MSVALRLAAQGHRIGLLAKKGFEESSSCWAQGGVAAAIGADDSPALHTEDTLTAGAGLCHRDVVEHVARSGAASIRWLQDQGVVFTCIENDSALHLTREGGHSRRRVVHAADASGQAIVSALAERVRENRHITVLDGEIAIDVISRAKLHPGAANRCLGAYALDRASGHVRTHAARAVVLATGGAAKTYLYTTNPDTSTGDGIAMAWRAGCRVANLEFVQFHPTCLYHPQAKSFLISEAVRGEGAQLLLPNGRRFMPDHDPRAELAPRDIVARAIDYEMKRGGFECVFLDISHKNADDVRRLFPNIAARCR
ncbi:MAG: FAD-binding protein, partial [Gammaproteobacteria bacterium]|nr:FAD-binding protein [Gammaproteobacteria bacterium]